MKLYNKISTFIAICLIFTLMLGSCQEKTRSSENRATAYPTTENSGNNRQNGRKSTQPNRNSDQSPPPGASANDSRVPKKVYEVLQYVRQNGDAPNGYVGGRTFQNRERRLPAKDEYGKKIAYQEWDVNPKTRGQNRGAERLVTSPQKAYFTADHYKTFIEIKE